MQEGVGTIADAEDRTIPGTLPVQPPPSFLWIQWLVKDGLLGFILQRTRERGDCRLT